MGIRLTLPDLGDCGLKIASVANAMKIVGRRVGYVIAAAHIKTDGCTGLYLISHRLLLRIQRSGERFERAQHFLAHWFKEFLRLKIPVEINIWSKVEELGIEMKLLLDVTRQALRAIRGVLNDIAVRWQLEQV
ncbi:MAG: hypothetical protein ABSH48_27040 [Verrucomicrobiota bacterium]